MKSVSRSILFAAFASLCAVALGDGEPKPPQGEQGQPRRTMKTYPTKYYVIRSDLDRDDTREAAARMTAMAEEYYQRTKSFSGKIAEPMDFYLYSRAEDYFAAGGIKGSAGCYNGKQLMAIAGEDPNGESWRIIQHEGFHQFMHRVIRGRPPTFIEEGMAEYFGYAIFTGDGFVSGAVHPYQRKMVQAMIKDGSVKPVEQMLQLSKQKWNDKIDWLNYLHAWSMVQFLVHGDDGKYEGNFEKFLKAVSKGGDWRIAWRSQFGASFEAVDKKWAKWWSEIPEDVSADLYDRAVVATVTSFFARANSQKQAFESMEAFFGSAGAGELKAAREDWLPPTLLSSRLERAQATGKWSIVPAPPGKLPQVCCLRKDGSTFTGQFTLKKARVEKVVVQLRKPAPATQPSSAR